MTATTTPLGGILMGDRCLSALKALGGKAATARIRAQAQADWNRPLTDAQVGVTLARLSREHPPKVSKQRAPEGGWLWRAAFTPADAEELAAALSVLEDRVTAAVREAPCLPPGLTAGSPRTEGCGPGCGLPSSAARTSPGARTPRCSRTGQVPAPAACLLTTRCTGGREGLRWPCSGGRDSGVGRYRVLGCGAVPGLCSCRR